MFVKYNPNPHGNRVGDCTVRALSKALNQPWKTTYIDMCLYGLIDGDMPSANNVWGHYLKDKGFARHLVNSGNDPNYTVADFIKDNPKGLYILAISGHVVCIEDGCIYDSWDSSQCIPIYYWRRE